MVRFTAYSLKDIKPRYKEEESEAKLSDQTHSIRVYGYTMSVVEYQEKLHTKSCAFFLKLRFWIPPCAKPKNRELRKGPPVIPI